MLRPQLDLDGNRRSADPLDRRDRFGEFAGSDRFLEIDAIDRGGNYGLPARAHRRN